MSDIASFTSALSGRYTVERELGQGGMATVYLARDLQHDRLVALKALHPDLTSMLGDDRFRREVRLVAQLQHPHIVPVFDSGEADGRLWFTMPYVEGESLRARLVREGGLPFGDIARLTAQVASALDEAHRRGILHRDVKPENILLTAGGDALLSDFGVARPVERGTGATLTNAGFVVGTPLYMSPEQAAGDQALDARSDVYALGCVVFELLTGEPPHLGSSPLNIMMKRMSEAPPSALTLRPTMPRGWDAVLSRALAVAPADRFATAGEFAAALALLAPSGGHGPGVAGSGLRSRRGALGLVFAVVAALAVAGVLMRRGERAPALDRALLAVLPFRVATADTALAYLGEGMVDLLAVKFTGEGGPRAVDPRASNAAWRQVGGASASPPVDAAPRAARALGAGLILADGAVVGDARRVTISATLSEVDGKRGAPASVSGPPDSLPALVDQLASEMLADRAGEQARGLAGATTLPALRAYLAGRANNRRGRYAQAREDFDRALDEDSTFTLAALGALALQNRGGALQHDAARLAWAGRDRLSRADHALLLAMIGPKYPAPSSTIEIREQFRQVTALAPDRAEAWFELGDMTLHSGLQDGLVDYLPAAIGDFRRALALDSSYNLPLEHLVRANIELGDTATVRQLLSQLLAQDTVTDWFPALRWQIAQLLGDSTTVRAVRRRLDSALAAGTGCRCGATQIASAGQVRGLASADAERAARVAFAEAATPGGAVANRRLLAALLVNVGQPAAAAAVEARPVAGAGPPSMRIRSAPLFEWLVNNGDSGAGRRSEAVLSSIAQDRAASAGERGYAVCMLGIAAGIRRDAAGIVRALDQLASLPAPASRAAGDNQSFCQALLGGWRAAGEQRGNAVTLIARADSILVWSSMTIWELGSYAIGLAASDAGDLELARRSMGREMVQTPDDRLYYAAYLRERGRLALLAGDTREARQQWRYYLALREDVEPSLRAAVDSVRAALAKIAR